MSGDERSTRRCEATRLRFDFEVVAGPDSLPPLTEADRVTCESDMCQVYDISERFRGRTLCNVILRCGRREEPNTPPTYLAENPRPGAWVID